MNDRLWHAGYWRRAAGRLVDTNSRRSLWWAFSACALVIVLQVIFWLAFGIASQGRDIAVIVVSRGSEISAFCFAVSLLLFGLNCHASSLLLLSGVDEADLPTTFSLRRFEQTAMTLGLVPSILTGITYLSMIGLSGSGGSDAAPSYPLVGAALALVAGALTFFAMRWIHSHMVSRHVSGHARYFVVDRVYRRLYNFTAAAAVVTAALILLFAPSVQRIFGPATILLIGLNGYLIALTFLSRQLQRFGLPLLLVIVVWAALASLVGTETHHLRTVQQSDRPSANAFARDWLLAADSRAETRGQSEIPVVIVLAEGGGIRAGQQANAFLTEMDRLTGGALFQDIYVLSGVSGGALGISTYTAGQMAEDPDIAACTGALFFEEDHMSSLLSGLLIVDIPSRFVPVEGLSNLLGLTPDDRHPDYFDRSDTFESSIETVWARSMEACGGPDLARAAMTGSPEIIGYLAAGADESPGPVLLMSTLRANDGQISVASNVSFQTETAMDLITLQDDMPGQSLPLSAAAHVSARFPVINPVAVVDTVEDGKPVRLRYVDGAYYDNSGAAAAQAALNILLDEADKLGLSDRLSLQVIHLYARDVAPTRAPGAGDKRGGLFAQSLTPAKAVAAARETRGRMAVVGLCRMLSREAAALSQCESLYTYRNAGEADSDPVYLAGSDAVVAAVPRHSGADDGLVWLNAPLDVSMRARDARYAPLGWLLSDKSRAYVNAESRRIAVAVCLSLSEYGTAAQTYDCTSRPLELPEN